MCALYLAPCTFSDRKPHIVVVRITRMRQICLLLVVLVSATAAATDPPPLKAAIGGMVEGLACASDPSQTYTLYLPPGFSNQRRWPVLLIFDPRGRSVLAAELFREAADLYGWILVSSNDTRSDGPMEPNVKALNALWPEVHTRLPADFNRIYAAGFSGGAAVSYMLAKSTGEVAGIIACGGRMLRKPIEGTEVPIFSTAGIGDFNFREMHQVDDFLAEEGNPHRLVIFDGDHTWMPPSVAQEGVEWLELIAMQQGLREIDRGLVDSLYEQAMASAAEMRLEGNEVEAARRYREIGRTYNGLHDTSAAQKAVDEIENGAEFRSQRKAVKRAQTLERRCLERMGNQLSTLRSSEIPPPVSELARIIQLSELQRQAEELPGVEGLAAQRCLNSVYTGLSYYLPRDLLPLRRYAQVTTAYELALTIRDDNPVIWYNLGCVRALLNREDQAMEALRRSLDLGFNRTDLLATDSDLDSLRDREDFKILLAAQSPR
jgi:predicted esterase